MSEQTLEQPGQESPDSGVESTGKAKETQAEGTGINWEARFKEAKEGRDKAKEALRNYESQTKKLESELKTFRQKEQEAEQKKLEERGEYQKILEQKESEWKEQQASLMKKYQEVTIHDRLTTALTDAGCVDPDLVAHRLKDCFSINPESLDVQVNEDQLKALGIDPLDDLRPKSMAQIVGDYLAKKEHLQSARMPGGGSGTRQTQTKSIGLAEFRQMSPMEIADFAKTNPAKYREFLAQMSGDQGFKYGT